MTKKRARFRFIWLSILVLIGIVLSVCSFRIPFTNYTYNGFANSISLGLDLSGGVSIVYDCSLNEGASANSLSDGVKATVSRLEQILYSEGYSEAKVSKQGTSKIRIEVPSTSDTAEIFDFLENPKTLYMTLEEANGSNNPEVFVTGFDIKAVNPTYQPGSNSTSGEGQYGVVIEFNTQGVPKFTSLTEKAAAGDQKIYVYQGEVNANNLFGALTCDKKITGGSTFISGEGITDSDSAKAYAYNILSGSFNVKLDLIENSVISATLGKNALFYGIIAGIVGIILIMAIMWWRYGSLGLLANFALIVYGILMLFFLQAIPFIQLTLPGIAGIILSLGMAVDGNIIIFERIKEEYASGKKIPLAVKSGFKRAFWPIFDSNITTIFTSIILYILGTPAIKGFAITLALGVALSMFTTLVVTRFFVKSYLPLNSTKPNKLRLYRDKNVVEIKEEEEEVKIEAEKVNAKNFAPEIVVGGDTNE